MDPSANRSFPALKSPSKPSCRCNYTWRFIYSKTSIQNISPSMTGRFNHSKHTWKVHTRNNPSRPVTVSPVRAAGNVFLQFVYLAGAETGSVTDPSSRSAEPTSVYFPISKETQLMEQVCTIGAFVMQWRQPSFNVTAQKNTKRWGSVNTYLHNLPTVKLPGRVNAITFTLVS